MLNVRLEDKHRNHLDRVADNRSEYIRELIEDDIKRIEPKDPKAEYVRCQENILYFVREYGYRKSPRKGIVRIEGLNNFQQNLLHDLAKGEDVFIKKGRQKRVTTTLQHFILWKSIFHSNITTCLSSYKIDNTSSLKKDIINYGYNLLPEAFKCGFMKNVTRETTFKNASSIFTTTQNHFSPDLLVVEEAGYIDDLPLDNRVDMRPKQTVITVTVQKPDFENDESTIKKVEPNHKEKLSDIADDMEVHEATSS